MKDMEFEKPERQQSYSDLQLADVVYFYQEGSDKAIKVYLQCDKSAVDAGILLVSGMEIVDKSEISEDIKGNWKLNKVYDGKPFGSYAQIVDKDTFAKILLQGAGQLTQLQGVSTDYFFINLDEPIEKSFYRVSQRVNEISGNEKRSNLVEAAFDGREDLYSKLIENVDLENGKVKKPILNYEMYGKGFGEVLQTLTRKAEAQKLECNIELKRRYNNAHANENVSTNDFTRQKKSDV